MTVATRDVGVKRGGRWCLRDVSITPEAGAFTAFLGPNGAGKSTLLGALTGDLTPSTGTVTLDGLPLHGWRPRDLARRRAVLPQHAELAFDFPVLDVVRMGRMPHDEPRGRADRIARAALASVGMDAFVDRSWFRLSGGERQRVQLARVLAQVAGQEAPLVFLDEPTNHLDIRQRYEVLARLRALARTGTTVVAVLHDLDLAARFADRVALLHEGRLVAHGPTAEILVPDRVRSVFGLEIELVPAAGTGVLLPVPRWDRLEAS
jgi:iron complex transport system ATP-binding protein